MRCVTPKVTRSGLGSDIVRRIGCARRLEGQGEMIDRTETSLDIHSVEEPKSRPHEPVAPPVAVPVPRIGWKDIWRQFKADMLSKEVQTSATYSYQWVACEVGHIGLGMVAFFALRAAAGWPNWLSLLLVAAAAIAKEVRDVYETNKAIGDAFDARLDKQTVRVDAVLAVLYMVAGAVLAFGVVESWPFWGYLLCLAPLAAVTPWALRQKMYFQQAALPYLFRLPEFAAPLDPAAVTVIKDFLAGVGARRPRHLVVLGPLRAGKTSLAVGIGTEAAFKRKVVRYLSFAKLCEIGLDTEPPPPRNTVLWCWRQSQLVIIDDVARALDLFRQNRAHSSLSDTARELKDELARRHAIWVVDDAGGKAAAAQWSSMIQHALGLPESAIAWVTVEQNAGNGKPLSLTGASPAGPTPREAAA